MRTIKTIIISSLLFAFFFGNASGEEERSFTGIQTKANAIALSPDGRYALAGSNDNALRLWDLSKGVQIRTFTGHRNPLRSIAFSSDGRHILSGDWGGAIKLWDVAKGEEIQTFTGHKDAVLSVAFSPDGRHALSGSNDRTLKLWDVARGREIRTFTGHKDTYGYSRIVLCVTFSPDGRDGLSGGGDNNLSLWDLTTGLEVTAFKGHSREVYCVALSSDGRHALSGTFDRTVKLWDVKKGNVIKTFEGHEEGLCSVAFSPDGRQILSVSFDKTVKLWDVETGKEIRTFKGHGAGLSSAAFSRNGRYVLMGGQEGTTQLWDISTGQEIVQMVSFKDGEWVILTPEGYFNASPRGAENLSVRIGNEVYNIDQFYNKFYRPELIELALTGKKPASGKKPPKMDNITTVATKLPAPSVTIVSPPSGITIDQEKLSLEVSVKDNGGGIGEIMIYCNGVQMSNQSRGIALTKKEGAEQFRFDLLLPEGKNNLRVIASNKDGSMVSKPSEITVNTKIVAEKPNLHAIIVGINEYQNKSITLKYAVIDAKAFATVIKEKGSTLFNQVNVSLLTTPSETTREAIARTFEKVRENVKPNDLFIFFNASHGIVTEVDKDEQFYLLTSNVLHLSSDRIVGSALSQKELVQLIGSIPAQKKLIFLDTCHAGKVGKEIKIALLEQGRGLTESTAIKILYKSVGSSVFSASSDKERSFEGYQGHGLFTYVLLEGLRGKADMKKEGFVTVNGLKYYMEDEIVVISEKVFKRQQTPIIEAGANFPIVKSK